MNLLSVLFQIFPVGGLLGVYCFWGIIPAIQAYLGVVVVQSLLLILMKGMRGKQLFKYGLAILLASLALVTSNLNYFYFEISLYYFLTSIILCIALYGNGLNIKKFSEATQKIQEHKIPFMVTIILCFSFSVLNYWVLINYSQLTWVIFRVFGPLVLMFILPLILGALFSLKYYNITDVE